MTQTIPNPQTAWQRYRPSADSPWNIKRAGHLYRRAAFGATIAELRKDRDRLTGKS